MPAACRTTDVKKGTKGSHNDSKRGKQLREATAAAGGGAIVRKYEPVVAASAGQLAECRGGTWREKA